MLPSLKKIGVEKLLQNSVHKLSSKMCKQSSGWCAAIKLADFVLDIIWELQVCIRMKDLDQKAI
jgi:hypothetical protein